MIHPARAGSIPALVLALLLPLAPPARANPQGEARLLQRVEAAFATLRSTLYQHHTAVDVPAGSYRFDCVGMVSWALSQATPEAWQSLRQTMGIRPGRIPSPPTLVRFFHGLQRQPQVGWHPRATVAELQAGDVLAWDHRSSHASGHAVILAAAPQPLAEGLWRVEVYDATSTPHQQDSRPGDPRALVFARTGRRSGLGHGVMALQADPASGALVGFRWRPDGPTVLAPIGAGQPLR